MTYTCIQLEETLKQVWNNEAVQKAFDLELEGLAEDMNNQILRQNNNIPVVMPRYTGYVSIGGVDTPLSPGMRQAIAARRGYIQVLEQETARAKRRGKPSYRQRQKNGRTTIEGSSAFQLQRFRFRS